ncbi:MAG: hypothetical protein GXO24_02815 [Chlorobi bacterium]|nr:hypothetical protein [Chlorobiota bacterium]
MGILLENDKSMKQFIPKTVLFLLPFLSVFMSCHRTEPVVSRCDTTDLGLDTTFQYSTWDFNDSGDVIGVDKWKWGVKGDTLIICGNEGFAYGEDSYQYGFYFVPHDACIDYVKTSLDYMSDEIIIDANTGEVISGIDYEEYTEGPFRIQEYEPGVRLVAQVGPHRFWVEFERENWFDASHCGAPE